MEFIPELGYSVSGIVSEFNIILTREPCSKLFERIFIHGLHFGNMLVCVERADSMGAAKKDKNRRRRHEWFVNVKV